MSCLPLVVVQIDPPPVDVRRVFGVQADWFVDALAPVATRERIRIVNVAEGDALPPPADIAGAIIPGSWSMVTDRADWSERTGAWVRQLVAAGTPLMGVCYGHQLMAAALGGVVGDHPAGRELGRLNVACNAAAADDPWLAGLDTSFAAYLTHRQSVLRPPESAQVLAASAHDAHQILRYSPTAVSVQFHPEFTTALLLACIERARADLGDDAADAMARPLREGHRSGRDHARVPRALLHRFAADALADSGPRS